MLVPKRDMLVLWKDQVITEQEMEFLRYVLQKIDTRETFCQTHELVNRNRITVNPKKLLRETRFVHLRPFRFLINKN